MVVPTCPITRSSLTAMDAMVNTNTRPADVTTAPVPAIARMIPVFNPAPTSSLNRDTKEVVVRTDGQQTMTDIATIVQYLETDKSAAR